MAMEVFLNLFHGSEDAEWPLRQCMLTAALARLCCIFFAAGTGMQKTFVAQVLLQLIVGADKQQCDAIIACGAVPPLLEAFRSSSSAEIRESAVDTIKSLVFSGVEAHRAAACLQQVHCRGAD